MNDSINSRDGQPAIETPGLLTSERGENARSREGEEEEEKEKGCSIITSPPD